MYLKSRQKLIIPFILPTFIVYTIFVFIPLFLTVSYSLTNWQGHTLDRPWYGLRNYLLIFKDPQIINAIKNTALFSVSGALIIFIPALYISWALTQKIKMKAVYRYIIIGPLVLSVVVVALLWKLLYNPVFGPINNVLKLIGLDVLALTWLGNKQTALLAIVVATAWQQLGMWILLISAGLERIPREILEAAKIDGASEWQLFWQVTFPLLWGILRLLFILWVILSLQVFAQVWVMTPHGGVGGSTSVFATIIYTRAFESNQWGLAAAMATLLMFSILVITLTMNRVTKRETIEF
ncbi:MAG: sugar ABC transporter permease [Anaerolineaceae bacterium]|nr:sugar ABC transporter permease [Anaerolineaceae bacterium]